MITITVILSFRPLLSGSIISGNTYYYYRKLLGDILAITGKKNLVKFLRKKIIFHFRFNFDVIIIINNICNFNSLQKCF